MRKTVDKEQIGRARATVALLKRRAEELAEQAQRVEVRDYFNGRSEGLTMADDILRRMLDGYDPASTYGMVAAVDAQLAKGWRYHDQ